MIFDKIDWFFIHRLAKDKYSPHGAEDYDPHCLYLNSNLCQPLAYQLLEAHLFVAQIWAVVYRLDMACHPYASLFIPYIGSRLE
ncbi:MAG: hypothetical protein WC749_03720 [Dehalococcoidia bacterium]